MVSRGCPIVRVLHGLVFLVGAYTSVVNEKGLVLLIGVICVMELFSLLRSAAEACFAYEALLQP